MNEYLGGLSESSSPEDSGDALFSPSHLNGDTAPPAFICLYACVCLITKRIRKKREGRAGGGCPEIVPPVRST